MKEKWNIYQEKIFAFWKSRSGKQKGVMLVSGILLVFVIAGSTYLSNYSKMVPLYKDISLQEAGRIKEELDARGIKYELQNAGNTILVPEEEADALVIDLAAQGLPNSGSIDYSFFSANTSWGMSDDEFAIIQLDAMQTELANLIKNIEGIHDANVMINKPAEAIFVSDQREEASASIVLQTDPGYQMEGRQVQALYHLVAKTVPNLPTDNIVIMNQYFEYYDLNNSNNLSNGNQYANQQSIKKDIERDIQRRVQQMVGMMVGNDKVVASVTADIDFTQEQRVEELVEPIDEETMEGLPVSIETIQETYTGEPLAGGEAGTGDEDITNFPAAATGDQGDYEMVKESINNEFNRIKKEIVESPYKIRDLGIQVAVDNRKEDGEEQEYLTPAEEDTVREGIASILNSMIDTSVDAAYGEFNPNDKVSIVFQEFSGNQTESSTASFHIPAWVYIVGALLLALIGGLIWMLFKKKKEEKEEELVEADFVPVSVPDIGSEVEDEAAIRKKQLEKMAGDRPEDFAKLLRSWLSED